MPAAPAAPAELTRQRLVRAALELFTTRGYHDTTTAQIARKAGVAEGTIYRHFRGKQHLWNELYRGAVRWALKLVQDAEASGGTARVKLSLAAQALLEGAAREPGVARFALLEGRAPALDDDSRKTTRELHTAVERLVAQGKAEGVVRPGAADLWAELWLTVVRHAVERVVAREWKPGDAAVGLVIEGAWEAIGV